MKVKNHLIPLFENGTKTIELRKVSKLDKYLEQSKINNGRFTINLYAANPEFINRYNLQFKASVGKIIINGYEIIPNLFQHFINHPNYRDIGSKYEREDTCAYLKSNIGRDNGFNVPWIYDNLDWLIKYFKDEPEILVLKIERFEGD